MKKSEMGIKYKSDYIGGVLFTSFVVLLAWVILELL
jgi:hypothetical protein